MNARLRTVKELAAENDEKVRDHITPYSFRDLYISELLMMGNPPFKVAKLAGTSLREIERTYGHFFNADLASSQFAACSSSEGAAYKGLNYFALPETQFITPSVWKCTNHLLLNIPHAGEQQNCLMCRHVIKSQ